MDMSSLIFTNVTKFIKPIGNSRIYKLFNAVKGKKNEVFMSFILRKYIILYDCNMEQTV